MSGNSGTVATASPPPSAPPLGTSSGVAVPERPQKAGLPKGHRLWNRTGIAIALAAIVALGIALVLRSRMAPQVGYLSAPVVRKDLVQTVTASGTVNPQDLILIGTQVSGTISQLYVDYNSVVKKGQVLARIDPTSLQAQLDAARAGVSQSHSVALAGEASASSAAQNVTVASKNAAAASAALASAGSQVAKSKAALDLANLTLSRDRQLLAQGYVAQAQFDADASAVVAARAAYAAATIGVEQARAQLGALLAATTASASQARSASASATANRSAIDVQRAQMAQALYNENHSVIVSPVDGTVIQRNVSVGQTVAASLQTPTLFSVARDLSKMEVDVAVGEPDVGGVRAGDATDFTVLAYPNRTFHGAVYQVRRNPTTVNNVVTYDTVVYVRNTDGALLPGMTANASIHVAKVRNALVVPVAALQWAPPSGTTRRQTTGAAKPASPWGTTEASLTRTIVAGRNGRVFTLKDGKLTRVPVSVLLVSDTEAAVAPLGGSLVAGEDVVDADTSTQMASQQPAARSSLTGTQPAQSRSGGLGR